jgi:hypothetical protein
MLDMSIGGYIGAAIGLIALIWCIRAAWCLRVKRPIMRDREKLLAGVKSGLAPRDDTAALAEKFAQTSMIKTTRFLDDATLQKCQKEARDNLSRVTRNYLPGHKQGATVSYDTLHHHALTCLSLYHSPAVLDWVSSVVGVKVHPAGDHDLSACSILYYTQAGDYINWHYDYNFYVARQFTVLIILEDKAPHGGPTSASLMRKHPDGTEERVEAAINEIVVFEGTKVLHKVSPASAGDTRIVLSMTLNTDPRISLFRELVRRVKDVAFWGIRALWD